ncbi:GntR family transcriptional regulator [Nonomuraea sp. NN258]|uniref:TetR/AcrR family transcriptional regulator C-terminal domain-containing protein n=1 Tax=Nonomuraea antri TaxID=2730852 RepID=UPI00156A6CA1|nr:GntR family transcriptional regulator [Nonomuraea antri]NRQ33170.1 GntR family transcriptional regulator [Nonomuraea antri]
MQPYARIIEDIKRRIADGRLRPGERVPSTRQIARDWGVALATAAKALTLLAQEGVVIAEPRVGTVVAQPRLGSPGEPSGKPAPRRAPPSESDLTRERIVRAAIEIADAAGLAELTMRRIAARLEVATMSLYRHVGSKDELVLLMADHVIAEFPLPAEPPPGWRARLEVAARVQWAAYREHPWMARVVQITRPLASPGLLTHAEWFMAALADTRLDSPTKMYVQILAYSYVQSIAGNLELELAARATTGVTGDQWVDDQAELFELLADADRYPELARMSAGLGADFDLGLLDDLFEFGLIRLLDGLERLIEPS